MNRVFIGCSSVSALKSILKICVALILWLSSPAWSQQKDLNTDSPEIVTNKQDSDRRFLLILTPPIAGYKSTVGTIYDFTPIGIEVPVHDRIGFSLKPALYYYESAIQSFILIAKLPVYSKRGTQVQPYGGFYLGPIIGAGMDFRDEKGVAGVGLEGGYSWALQSEWQLKLGLGFTIIPEASGGIRFEIGHWY